MLIVTRSTLEGSVFVQDTVQTTYVDLMLDQTLPRGAQNDGPLRDLQMRDPSESTTAGVRDKNDQANPVSNGGTAEKDGYIGLC
jgi:hypothetical protein